jgi:aminoglycoside 6'-N-acetyltransferase I
MKHQIRYREFEELDFPSLLKMAEQLWTKYKKDDLATHLRNACNSKTKKVFLALTPEEEVVGFSIFSIRTDYVEGATSSPTGYLEGIFIEAGFRKLGIAKSFIQQGEAWCKEKGCTQLGSDTWLTATESRKFHKKLGFREEDELVHFLKNI